MLFCLDAYTINGQYKLPAEETLPRKIGWLLFFVVGFIMLSMLAYNDTLPIGIEGSIFLLLSPITIGYYLYLVSYDLAFLCAHYIRRYRRHKNTEYQ